MDSVWFGDEPAAVEARFLPEGRIRPTALRWRGRQWQLTGLGRQWEEADGSHMLAMASDGSRFELCLGPDRGSWRLRRAWTRLHLV
jgi:hypothetical protein